MVSSSHYTFMIMSSCSLTSHRWGSWQPHLHIYHEVISPSLFFFYKPVRFILQDRVHHHVTGCCHPDNVSFTDVHLKIKVWWSDRTASQSEAVSYVVRDWSQFAFISMWPRFLQVQTQWSFLGGKLCCISVHCPPKLSPKCFKMLAVCWIASSLTMSLVA